MEADAAKHLFQRNGVIGYVPHPLILVANTDTKMPIPANCLSPSVVGEHVVQGVEQPSEGRKEFFAISDRLYHCGEVFIEPLR